MSKQNDLIKTLLMVSPVFFLSILIASSSLYRDDALLFCLKPEYQQLNIQKTSDGIIVDLDVLDNFFNSVHIKKLEPWLPGATSRPLDVISACSGIVRIFQL